MNKTIFKIFNSLKGKKISTSDLKSASKKALNLGINAKDFLLLINLIKDVKNKKYHLDKKAFITLTAAILYVVIPTDAVCDFIPILGWIDDSIIVAFIVKNYSYLINNYKNFLENKKKSKSNCTAPKILDI